MKSFESITCISRRRLNNLGRKFFFTQQATPSEERGGSKQTEKDRQQTESIIEHIQIFKCRKSHLMRKDYLDAT